MYTAMGSLDGKNAVITGGASGIGLATAQLFVEEGGHVLLVDLNEEAGTLAAKELDAQFVAADVGQPSDWERVAAAARDGLGGIDAVYLNAGVTTGEADITKLTDAQYRRIMGPNIDGVVFGARAMVPLIEQRGGGAVVATASLAGLIAFDRDPIYTMTKHAVVGLVRGLAPQLQAKGITINAVCPGITKTPLVGDAGAEMLEKAGFPIIPARQIAEAVLMCVTGTATGQAYACQAGREPVAYHFNRVPGPRAEGAEGKLPPGELAGWDQVKDDQPGSS